MTVTTSVARITPAGGCPPGQSSVIAHPVATAMVVARSRGVRRAGALPTRTPSSGADAPKAMTQTISHVRATPGATCWARTRYG